MIDPEILFAIPVHVPKNPLPFGKRDDCKVGPIVDAPSPPAPLPKRGEGSETFAARIVDRFSIDPVRGTASLDSAVPKVVVDESSFETRHSRDLSPLAPLGRGVGGEGQ